MYNGRYRQNLFMFQVLCGVNHLWWTTANHYNMQDPHVSTGKSTSGSEKVKTNNGSSRTVQEQKNVALATKAIYLVSALKTTCLNLGLEDHWP